MASREIALGRFRPTNKTWAPRSTNHRVCYKDGLFTTGALIGAILHPIWRSAVDVLYLELLANSLSDVVMEQNANSQDEVLDLDTLRNFTIPKKGRKDRGK